MCRLFEQPYRRQVRVVEYLVESGDPRARDVEIPEEFQPFIRRLALQRLSRDAIEVGDVLASCGEIEEARIAAQLRLADGIPELPPLRIRVGEHADVAVLGSVRPPPRGQQARIS